jgi:hypothetical protein
MLVLIADGLHNSVPEVSSLESALGLAGTITALILFVRACVEAPDRSDAPTHTSPPPPFRGRREPRVILATGACVQHPRTR